MDPMATGPSRAPAPPSMDSLGMDAFVNARTVERDAAVAEVARLQPLLTEVQSRFAAVRRRVAQAQELVAAARKERAAEEERFRRQVDARPARGGREAQKGLHRRAMGEVARIALEDVRALSRRTVGARPTVPLIERTGGRRRRPAGRSPRTSIRAALSSFDLKALQSGVALGAAAVVLFLLLFFSPVIIRSCSSDTGTISPASSAP